MLPCFRDYVHDRNIVLLELDGVVSSRIKVLFGEDIRVIRRDALELLCCVSLQYNLYLTVDPSLFQAAELDRLLEKLKGCGVCGVIQTRRGCMTSFHELFKLHHFRPNSKVHVVKQLAADVQEHGSNSMPGSLGVCKKCDWIDIFPSLLSTKWYFVRNFVFAVNPSNIDFSDDFPSYVLASKTDLEILMKNLVKSPKPRHSLADQRMKEAPSEYQERVVDELAFDRFLIWREHLIHQRVIKPFYFDHKQNCRVFKKPDVKEASK